MMKLVLVVAFFGACMAFPSDPTIPILHEENVVEHDGKFHYSFETADGTKVQEQGELKTIGSETGEAVSGDFSYTSPDGSPIAVHYVADENGYQPTGEHIHNIPEAIARSIKWNEDHPEAESVRGKTRV